MTAGRRERDIGFVLSITLYEVEDVSCITSPAVSSVWRCGPRSGRVEETSSVLKRENDVEASSGWKRLKRQLAIERCTVWVKNKKRKERRAVVSVHA